MKIDLSLNASLDFSPLLKEEKLTLLEIDFDFDLTGSLFSNPLRLSSYQMAMKELSAQVLEVRKEEIQGISLYHGGSDLSHILGTSEELFMMYQEWLDGREDRPFERELFSMSIFIEFLHRLGSIVPETIPLYVSFYLSHPYRLSEIATLFSKERFLHLQVRVENCPLSFEGECLWGVILPQEHLIDYELLDEMLKALLVKTETFRVLPEAMVSDMWHGLEYILFSSKCLTREGERMLQGFNAAGGKAYYYDEGVGLHDEERFGVEGFEPPTYCSQSSRASQTALYPETWR